MSLDFSTFFNKTPLAICSDIDNPSSLVLEAFVYIIKTYTIPAS